MCSSSPLLRAAALVACVLLSLLSSTSADYAVSSLTATAYGWQGVLKMTTPGPYGHDIPTLNLSVWYALTPSHTPVHMSHSLPVLRPPSHSPVLFVSPLSGSRRRRASASPSATPPSSAGKSLRSSSQSPASPLPAPLLPVPCTCSTSPCRPSASPSPVAPPGWCCSTPAYSRCTTRRSSCRSALSCPPTPPCTASASAFCPSSCPTTTWSSGTTTGSAVIVQSHSTYPQTQPSLTMTLCFALCVLRATPC